MAITLTVKVNNSADSIVVIKNDKPIKKNEVIKPKPISRSIINTNVC